jgi:Putative peptidoglycan binding domain
MPISISICRRGDTGAAVKSLQEWLCLSGNDITIDGEFGPATEQAIKVFQADAGLPVTGLADDETTAALEAPLQRVQACLPADNRMTLGELVVAYANQHLAEHPREIGGENCGPWVRLYMDGHEGPDWPWCAGFVSFILRQAATTLNIELPIQTTFSCDSLAASAAARGRLLPAEQASPEQITSGSFFLVRKSERNWTHTGIVISARDEYLETIEGNTNEDGSREGYEVVSRTRSYASKDFIIL